MPQPIHRPVLAFVNALLRPRSSPVRRLISAMRMPFIGRGGVLLYHRVTELANDPWALAIAPGHFAEQLAVLERCALCLSLGALLARRAAGTLPQNAVALTFDDGYADNLLTALPLLEQHGIPATIFIMTGFVGAAQETWWDRLEQAVFEVDDLPERLDLQIGRRHIVWSGSAAPDRAGLHTDVYDALAQVDTAEREAGLAELWRQLGQKPRLRLTHRALDPDELQRLAASPLVTIGAHTRTHPHLARISPSRQREELAGSKADLEAWLNRPIDLVAYPHGSSDSITTALAAEIGFTAGFTTASRIIPHGFAPLATPRISVEGQDGDEFAEQLRRYSLAR